VLIVDGHDDTRELYAFALTLFGFETVTDDDAVHACEHARGLHPDVVVTEVALPRVDGWHLIENLKSDPGTREIPIVVLTGHARSSVQERANRVGCVGVLVKPYLPEELAEALRELLGHKWSRQDLPVAL
jgi:two-component system chemotaxis response regulator CheY